MNDVETMNYEYHIAVMRELLIESKTSPIVPMTEEELLGKRHIDIGAYSTSEACALQEYELNANRRTRHVAFIQRYPQNHYVPREVLGGRCRGKFLSPLDGLLQKMLHVSLAHYRGVLPERCLQDIEGFTMSASDCWEWGDHDSHNLRRCEKPYLTVVCQPSEVSAIASPGIYIDRDESEEMGRNKVLVVLACVQDGYLIVTHLGAGMEEVEQAILTT